MITQLWRTVITALKQNITVFSQSDSDKTMRLIAQQVHLTTRQLIDWKRYAEPTKVRTPQEVISTLEQFLSKPLEETNKIVYVIFIFKGYSTVIKTDIITLLNNYSMVYWDFVYLVIWNSTEGYAIDSFQYNEIRVGRVAKGEDPAPQFAFKKNMTFYSFMQAKGPFYEFTKAFGLEIFGDDEANTILTEFQGIVPFTKWGRVDWDRFDKKIVVGKNGEDVLPTLQKLLKNKLDTRIYICHKQMEAPLMRINLTTETAKYRSIWSRAYGTFLFNLESGYVVEVDLLGNITVGLIAKP